MIRVLKKIFRKKKKEKEQECWYNNYHERTKTEWVPLEGGALAGENQYLYSTAQQAAKHQG
ncbi:MAG: hypothetical protein IKD47_01440 [Clostridia bacterium]|nr:hypothetical protein [Clostridia bacterium]